MKNSSQGASAPIATTNDIINRASLTATLASGVFFDAATIFQAIKQLSGDNELIRDLAEMGHGMVFGSGNDMDCEVADLIQLQGELK